MKGGMMERWRPPGGRDMKAQGGQPPQGLVGAVLFFLFFLFFFFFCSLVDIFHREEAGCGNSWTR